MIRNRRTHAWAAVTAMTLIAGACDPGTGPDVNPELDTARALEDLETLQSALASDDLAGFRALAGRTPFDDGPAAVGAVAGAMAYDAHTGGPGFVLGLARRVAATATAGDARPGPIISGWHRGTTFVYDPERDRYAPDLTRDGAPPTGVRFVLYEVNATGRPVPDQEIGYADLVDEGDGSVEDLSLRLTVIQHDQTVVEYHTTLDHDATSAGLTVDGFLAGDGVRLDFAVDVGVRDVDGVGEIDVDFELGVEARDFLIVGSGRGMEEGDDGEGRISLDVRHGEDRIEVEVTGDDGVLDGTVALDGTPFAVVTGPADDPVVTDPSGEPLDWAERVVLLRIMDVVEDVFDLLEDLLDPVDDLVLLGFLL